MIRAELVICAQTVIRDSSTNTFSLINVIQELRPPAIPYFIPSLSVMIVLRKDEEDPPTPRIKLEIIMGNGLAQQFPLDADFQNKSGTRLVTEFEGFALLAPGAMSFKVWEGVDAPRQLGEWTILVQSPPTPGVQGTRIRQLTEPTSGSELQPATNEFSDIS